MNSLACCHLCPRECGVDRLAGEKGYCRLGSTLLAARAMIHEGEEPCLIGKSRDTAFCDAKEGGKEKNASRYGAGAVFFSGCNLGCVFCQNEEISHEGRGWALPAGRLEEILLGLQEEGAATIDLVTPTPWQPYIRQALQAVKGKLQIPVVYNCGGYESAEALKELEGLVDIYLPDLKFFDPGLSARYAKAPDYFEKASAALREMYRQVPQVVMDSSGQMKKGLLVRHLVLPGASSDSLRLMDFLSETFPAGTIRISLLSQYTPYARASAFPEIDRRVTTYEYEKVVDYALARGLDGYRQSRGSSTMKMRPDFDGSGLGVKI